MRKKKKNFLTGTSSYYYFDYIYTLVWVYIVIPEIATSKKGWVMCRKKKLKKRNKYNYNEITSKHW